MRITLDTDKKIIIVPDNFFAKMEDLNRFRQENDVAAIEPMAYIKECFDKAMADIDQNLKLKSEAVVKREPKKAEHAKG